jgi:hypothetical protein
MTTPALAPVLLIKSGGAAALAEWRASFHEFAPELGLDVRAWDDPEVDPARVQFVLVWQPEPGRLAHVPQPEGHHQCGCRSRSHPCRPAPAGAAHRAHGHA